DSSLHRTYRHPRVCRHQSLQHLQVSLPFRPPSFGPVPKGTSSPTPASGLSIGAKAAIGVGSGVGDLALIAAGAYLGVIFHHRHNENDKPQVGRSAPIPSHENV